MYDCGIKASELIKSVRGETDISLMIPDETFLRSINTVEQFLYSEILKEYISVQMDYADITDDTVALGEITMPEGCDSLVFDDIIKVFADEWELERSGVIGVIQFPEKMMYYSDYDDNVRLSVTEYPEKITFIVRLRPALKSKILDGNVNIPAEFVELICARMRGDAYKIANEDSLAAKWLNDYNNQLETFKIWAMERSARFGG